MLQFHDRSQAYKQFTTTYSHLSAYAKSGNCFLKIKLVLNAQNICTLCMVIGECMYGQVRWINITIMYRL